jgi:hypothetical protein
LAAVRLHSRTVAASQPRIADLAGSVAHFSQQNGGEKTASDRLPQAQTIETLHCLVSHIEIFLGEARREVQIAPTA